MGVTGRGVAACTAAGGVLALGVMTVGDAEPAEAAHVALFGSLLVLLAWLDLRSRIIPNAIVYPALLLAVGLSPAGPGPGFPESLEGGVGTLAAWSAVRVLSRGGLGGGDVKMAALVGAVVGWPGVVDAGAVTAASAGLAAGVLLVLRLLRRDDALPYGPFIAFGGLVVMLT